MALCTLALKNLRQKYPRRNDITVKIMVMMIGESTLMISLWIMGATM